MLLTEYNEAEAMELFKEDGRREEKPEDLKIYMKKTNASPEATVDFFEIAPEKRNRFIVELRKQQSPIALKIIKIKLDPFIIYHDRSFRKRPSLVAVAFRLK